MFLMMTMVVLIVYLNPDLLAFSEGADTCDKSAFDRDCTTCSYQGASAGFKQYAKFGKCLKFVDTLEDWRTAISSCEAMGAKLFRAYDRNEALKGGHGGREYWIGLNDIEVEGDFRWYLGSGRSANLYELDYRLPQPGERKKLFAPWQPGQPDNRNDEDCVIMNKHGQWQDEDCNKKYGYLCQMVSGHKSAPPTMVIYFHKKNNTLVGGSSFEAWCSAYIHRESTLNWGTVGKIIYTNIESTLSKTMEKEFRFEITPKIKRCSMFANSTLGGWYKGQHYGLKVHSALDGARIQCCTSRNLRSQCKQMETCAYSPIINIIHKPRQPQLTIRFGKSAPIAYINTNVKGYCFAYVGTAGSLTLGFSNSKWQGSWTAVLGKKYIVTKQSLPGVEVRLLGAKPHYAKGPSLHLTFTARVSQDMNGAVVTCSAKGTGPGQKLSVSSKPWVTRCPPPEPPTLDLQFEKKPNVVYGGRPLPAECTAQLGSEDELDFRKINLESDKRTDELIYKSGSKAVKLLDQEDGARGRNPCARKVKARFDLTVSDALDGTQVSCCTKSEKSGLQCDYSRTITVEFQPSKPDLDITYHSGSATVNAKCFSHVGQEATLTWEVIVKAERMVWTLDKTGRVHGEVPDNVKISGVPGHNHTLGPNITSTLEIKTKRSKEMTIVCSSYNASKPGPVRFNLRVSGPAEAKTSRPGRPRLKVTFHDDPSVLQYGRVLSVSCLAPVGTGGIMTWVIHNQAETTKLAVGLKGILFENPPPGIEVSHIVDATSNGNPDVPTIVSRLAINVTHRLDGAVLACYSYDVRPDAVLLFNNTDTLWDASPPLKVKDSPQPPHLIVHYHEPPNIVEVGRRLQAYCSAVVGSSDGVITWLIMNDADTVAWPVNVRGKLLFHPPKYITIATSKETVSTKRGPEIHSSLQIKVRSNLNGSVIGCFSRHIDGDAFVFGLEYPLGQISLPLNVIGSEEAESMTFLQRYKDQIVSVATWVLLALALVALGTAAGKLLAPSRDTDNTDNSKSSDEEDEEDNTSNVESTIYSTTAVTGITSTSV